MVTPWSTAALPRSGGREAALGTLLASSWQAGPAEAAGDGNVFKLWSEKRGDEKNREKPITVLLST